MSDDAFRPSCCLPLISVVVSFTVEVLGIGMLAHRSVACFTSVVVQFCAL